MGFVRGGAWVALLAAGLITTLAGCISSKPLDEVSTVQSLNGQGAAVLRIAYDRNPERGDTETNIISVRVSRVDGGGRHRARLVRSSYGTYFTSTMGGVLEPGTYSMYVVEMLWEGEKRSLRLTENDLQFEVRPNSISVVGTLVIDRGGANAVYLPPQTDAVAPWVSQAFPLAEKPGVKTDYAPNVSTKLPTPNDGGAELKRRAQATASWVQLPNGNFAAPGRLGTVLHRHRTSSKAETIDVGTWSTVLFVGGVDNGVVVAGEEGLLRFSADGRSGWRQLRGPARGAIHAIQAFGSGKVAAMVRSGDRWHVFVTGDLFSGQWQELVGFSFQSADGSRASDGSFSLHLQRQTPLVIPFVVSAPDKLGIVQFDGAYQVVDLRSGKLVTGSLGPLVREISATREGTVVVKSKGSAGLVVSADGGASWQAMNPPTAAVLTATKDYQTHYAIVSESAGGQISGFSLQGSRDGGASWARAGAVPLRLGQAERLWILANTLQIETSDGGVLESSDEGKTWGRLP